MPEVTITVKVEIDEKLAEEIIGIIKETLYATKEAGPPRELNIEISDIGGRIKIRGEGGSEESRESRD